MNRLILKMAVKCLSSFIIHLKFKNLLSRTNMFSMCFLLTGRLIFAFLFFRRLLAFIMFFRRLFTFILFFRRLLTFIMFFRRRIVVFRFIFQILLVFFILHNWANNIFFLATCPACPCCYSIRR